MRDTFFRKMLQNVCLGNFHYTNIWNRGVFLLCKITNLLIYIYKQIRADVGEILGSLCRRKGIEIIEAECCPDHIHMLVRIPPKYSVSEIVGYLKGKSSLMIFERHANLKYKYGNRHFWCRGYYVDTVGKNTAKIKEYIQKQLKEDLEYDRMSLVE